MNETTARLLQLQQVDMELSALNRERRDKPRLLRKRRESLSTRESKLTTLADDTKHVQTQAMQRELEVETHEQKIEKLRVKLNMIKDNKEYRAMLHEIEHAQATLSDAETKLLMAYEEVEQFKEKRKRLEKEIEAERGELEEFAREIEETREDLLRSIEDSSARHREIAEGVGDEDLKLYERLERSKPGAAVVPVVGGACRGCFTSLTSNQKANLLGQDGLVTCASCGRIIYVGDDLSAEKMNDPGPYNPLS